MANDIARCVFGTPSVPHRRCQGCEAEARRLEREYALGQLLGTWDRDGYTPNERRKVKG